MAVLVKSAMTLHEVDGVAFRLPADSDDLSFEVQRDFGAAAVTVGVIMRDKPGEPVGLNSELPQHSIGLWVPSTLAAKFGRALSDKHQIVDAD